MRRQSQESQREAALLAIPDKYSLALRLRDAGADERAIADHLEIEVQAVPVFLAIAEDKLSAQQ